MSAAEEIRAATAAIDAAIESGALTLQDFRAMVAPTLAATFRRMDALPEGRQLLAKERARARAGLRSPDYEEAAWAAVVMLALDEVHRPRIEAARARWANDAREDLTRKLDAIEARGHLAALLLYSGAWPEGSTPADAFNMREAWRAAVKIRHLAQDLMEQHGNRPRRGRAGDA